MSNMKLAEKLMNLIKDEFNKQGKCDKFCPVCGRERIDHREGLGDKRIEIISALESSGYLNKSELQKIVGISYLTREALHSLVVDNIIEFTAEGKYRYRY